MHFERVQWHATTVLQILLTEEFSVEISADSPTLGNWGPPGPAPDLMCCWGLALIITDDPKHESWVSLTWTFTAIVQMCFCKWLVFKDSKDNSRAEKWSRGAQGDEFKEDRSKIQTRGAFCFWSHKEISWRSPNDVWCQNKVASCLFAWPRTERPMRKKTKSFILG